MLAAIAHAIGIHSRIGAGAGTDLRDGKDWATKLVTGFAREPQGLRA